MEFTYGAYKEFLELLMEKRYQFRTYHDYQTSSRCVILRHDIDCSIEIALKMARLEAESGVKSTYFVLLTSKLYNAASKSSLTALHEIQELGHDIGLHFDEKAYHVMEPEVMIQHILKECALLSALLDIPITKVSMHRPSPMTLNGNLQIPGVVNTYGQTFFHEFKYLSDSHRRWREPVLDIVRSAQYNRLHILTHAFWYHEKEETLTETIKNFVCSANLERYHDFSEIGFEMETILSEGKI